MAPNTDTQNADDSGVTIEDAYAKLVEGYGNPHPGLGDLTDLYDGVTAFISMHDQSLDSVDGDSLPDDLSEDTRRQLSTARTMLSRATAGIEETAQERLAGDTEGSDE